MYTHIYIWREIGRESVTLRIGSRNYGSHRVPWTAIHKLQNKESQCFSSVQVWRLQNQRSQWRKSHQQSKNPRRWRGAGRHNFVIPGPSCKAQEPGALMSGALSSGREQTPLPLLFAVIRPSADWMRSTCLGEDSLLYSVYWFKC